MPLQKDFATGLIDQARTWLGCKEDINTPNKSVCVNQIQELFNGSVTDEPWCAKYVWVVTNQTAQQFNIKNTLVHTASTVSMKDQAWKTGGITVDENPAPGSIFYYSTGAGHGHVGFVMEILPDGTLNTIEGNHNNAVSYGHRDPNASDYNGTMRFIHVENMAGGKTITLGLPTNQILLYSGIGLVSSFIAYKVWRHKH